MGGRILREQGKGNESRLLEWRGKEVLSMGKPLKGAQGKAILPKPNECASAVKNKK